MKHVLRAHVLNKEVEVNHFFVMPLLVAVGVGLSSCAIDTDPQERTQEPAVFAGSWPNFTSEEHPPLTCPNGTLVDEMQCTGSYCDNVALHCGSLNTSSIPGNFSNYISEESPNNNVECPTNQFMVGVARTGRYCDQGGSNPERTAETHVVRTGACADRQRGSRSVACIGSQDW